MAEAKGLNKPIKLKNELADFLGATELPRTEITKKLVGRCDTTVVWIGAYL